MSTRQSLRSLLLSAVAMLLLNHDNTIIRPCQVAAFSSTAFSCSFLASHNRGRAVLAPFESSSSSSSLLWSCGSSSGGGQWRLNAMPLSSSSSSSSSQKREDEIRRTIQRLKRQGKLKQNKKGDGSDGSTSTTADAASSSSLTSRKNTGGSTATSDVTSVEDYYANKIQEKLGRRKAALMGLDVTSTKSTTSSDDNIGEEEDDEIEELQQRRGQLGSLSPASSSSSSSVIGEEDEVPVLDKVEDDNDQDDDDDDKSKQQRQQQPIIDPSLFDYKDDPKEEEPDEEELIQLVAEKLAEQQQQRKQQEQQEQEEPPFSSTSQQQPGENMTSTTTTTMTSGVGGTWNKDSNTTATAQVETYKPKSGSWGAFPRPKDISKAYGGGRKIGAGIDATDGITTAGVTSTKERLQQYREKMGIDVASEKEHADTIDQALQLAGYAMQRGMYSSAVSCLEKVTKYCSTNSKVGGKVFLELAMAYEAEGRTQEAVTVYTTLSKSRIEEIKFDAKRLLYGIEAMQFMRNEARSEAFSRKKIRNTFIDTTGLANIADNFDDVYQTAYIDMDGGFYRRLTESVVRSNREARQILLQATGSGMVEHLKIIQALRSLSRHFDAALEEEEKRAAPQSVAVMNGKPIVPTTREASSPTVASVMAGMDEFVLASPEQMLELLKGDWGLQLVADRTGDGVKYDNNSTLQTIDTDSMTFASSRPAGFVKVSQSGNVDFESRRRILSKQQVSTAGGGMLSGLMSGGGKSGMTSAAQQVISVDSVLLVTRLAPDKKRSPVESSKGYFSVWRRVGSPVVNESELGADAV